MSKILTILLTIYYLTSFSQKEANLWYFGNNVGLDFNTGTPEILIGFYTTPSASSIMSDTNGNLLFASNAERIWNRNKAVMLNGDNLKGNWGASQGVVVVQKPNSSHLYYAFTTGDLDANQIYGLYYSVIDLDLDGGLGGVTNEKNILLTDAWDAFDKIVAVKHSNERDIWIITRKFIEQSYAVFLLTEAGIVNSAVISPAKERPFHNVQGNMKISQDKKHLVTAYITNSGITGYHDFEFCNFNATTGETEYLYSHTFFSELNDVLEPTGVEFSPDSKLLYLVAHNESGYDSSKLYQLEMQYFSDSTQFINSSIEIDYKPLFGLQLATDGKIYCTTSGSKSDYVSVIHEPWKRGTDCNFESDAIYLGEDKVRYFLPNILLDYLFRFEWEGRCSAEPFVFQSNFQPDPAYIRWSFSDPAAGADSISLDLNPVHYFTQGGEYEVNVFVQYPNGRIEETSRVVTVIESPHPDLGPDTLKCEMGNIILNAGDDEAMFVWSNGTFGNNARQITVSDTGWYWVQVTNSEGCGVRDSIYVGLFPKAIVNEDNLTIFPTGCGASNGKIMGITVLGTEPLSFEWFDAGGNMLGTSLDLTGLPVGNYFLHITDGNGCLSVSDAYTIEDSGDIEIAAVETQNAHCSQNTGSISITAVSGDPENLLYSIDNGASWQTGNSLFENLPFGNYFVRVKDLSGCESVFANNPVVVENIPGPEVTAVSTTPEIDYLQNGEIDISATANSGQLYYSIDNGTSFQTGNGQFSNLSSGTYNCLVKDDFGCDTAFTVVVDRLISQLIEAIAGNGYTCIGNAAVVPIKLDNFKDIFKFHLTLTYDTALLSCGGFINLNPLLGSSLTAGIIPGTDQIVISWQGDTPATLEENATLLELVFGAKEQGLSGIDWAATGGQSAFFNENLDEVSAQYHVGTLRIYTKPQIDMHEKWSSCEGYYFSADPYVSGGTGDLSYEWSGPNAFASTYRSLEIPNINISQAGIYTLIVTDTINCSGNDSIKVIVNENPQIAFAGQDTILAQPGFLLEAGSGYFYYIWNTGEKTDAIVINQEGIYSVKIGTLDQCFAADTVTILWGGEPFWLPNAFTPDGDGLNDVFKPVERYDLVKTYHLSIYSRWGELMFETTDISQGWDGTFKGNPVPGGSYVYRIVFTAYPDYSEKQNRTGSVVVVR